MTSITFQSTAGESWNHKLQSYACGIGNDNFHKISTEYWAQYMDMCRCQEGDEHGCQFFFLPILANGSGNLQTYLKTKVS